MEKEPENRKVLNRRRKTETQEAVLMSKGSKFHVRAAVIGKARSPCCRDNEVHRRRGSKSRTSRRVSDKMVITYYVFWAKNVDKGTQEHRVCIRCVVLGHVVHVALSIADSRDLADSQHRPDERRHRRRTVTCLSKTQANPLWRQDQHCMSGISSTEEQLMKEIFKYSSVKIEIPIVILNVEGWSSLWNSKTTTNCIQTFVNSDELSWSDGNLVAWTHR